MARGADAAPPGGPALVCTTGPVADGEWTLDRGNEDMWGGALTVSVDKTTRGCSTLTRQQMHNGIILFCVIALIVQCLIKGT